MLNIITISDLSVALLEVYARLSEVQLLHYYEPSAGLFIAESPNVIERAIHAGYRPESFLVEEKYLFPTPHPLLSVFDDIPIYTGTLSLLNELTGFHMTRGMLCAMKRLPLPETRDICRSRRRICVLENVMNPTNVGAIFRSAAGLNMDAVLLTKGCSDPFYRRAARVSMGTVFQIPWTYVEEDYPQMLKNEGFKTVAMALSETALPINAPELLSEERLAVILGTEGDGLAKTTIAQCDYTACIPMSHGVDSLNVAAASAVAFWQLGQPH